MTIDEFMEKMPERFTMLYLSEKAESYGIELPPFFRNTLISQGYTRSGRFLIHPDAWRKRI